MGVGQDRRCFCIVPGIVSILVCVGGDRLAPTDCERLSPVLSVDKCSLYLTRRQSLAFCRRLNPKRSVTSSARDLFFDHLTWRLHHLVPSAPASAMASTDGARINKDSIAHTLQSLNLTREAVDSSSNAAYDAFGFQ